MLRAEFPALQRYAWFNTPGAPPAARAVADAVTRATASWSDGGFDWMDWERDAEHARATFGRLLGVSSATIALVTSLAEAAATVAATVARDVPPGDVVLPAREFRSNLLPWLGLREAGFTTRLLDAGEPADWTSRLVDAITPGTRLVVLSEVQSASGVRADGSAVLEKCQAVGARLFLNATQSMGALARRAWHREVDYLAAHAYKWMLAPRGAAFLRVREDRLSSARPLAPNWKSVDRPYDDLYGAGATLSTTASRLDSSLAWLAWPGARAALELLEGLPAEEVEAHCVGLAAELRDALRERGFRVRGQDVPSQIVSVDMPESDALMTELKRHFITASSRDGCLRFGCHFFNSDADVARVLDVMGRAV